VQVQEPGFRVESLWVVTTLTDAQKYPREDITDLYRQRWMVEINQADYDGKDNLYWGA